VAGRDVRTTPELVQVQRVNDRRIGIGNQINHNLISLLERIHVVESEEGVALAGGDHLSIVFAEDMKARAALRLPCKVLDKGLAAEPQREGMHHQWTFGQNDILSRHAEGMHVRWPINADGANAVYASTRGIRSEEVIRTLPRELCAVAKRPAAAKIKVRMRRRELSWRRLVEGERAKSAQDGRIKHDRQRHLRQGDILVCQHMNAEGSSHGPTY
jgi:hypothetical protein